MHGFDEAIASHTLWKLKLKQHLNEKLKLEQTIREGHMLDSTEVANSHACELGQWIRGEGLRYHGIPCFEAMCAQHDHFHRAAAEVVRTSNAGNVDKALTLLAHGGAFEQLSNQLVQALIKCRDELVINQVKARPATASS
jgi:hypothetical protein